MEATIKCNNCGMQQGIVIPADTQTTLCPFCNTDSTFKVVEIINPEP